MTGRSCVAASSRPTSAEGSVYWVGEAMQAVDYKDKSPTPEATATATKTLARNAVHLAKLLKAEPYPAPE